MKLLSSFSFSFLLFFIVFLLFSYPYFRGGDLSRAVAEAPEGATLCLAPGTHDGPVTIQQRVTLRGPRDAVIRSRGRGSTVSIEAEGAAQKLLAVGA